MSKTLTKEQRDIVNFHNGHAIVKAVPGSGKTTTLVMRVLELLKRGVDYNKILVLMFNKAAQESFSENLKKAGRAKNIYNLPDVRTFDSFAYGVANICAQKGLTQRKMLTIPPSKGAEIHDKLIKAAYKAGYEVESSFVDGAELRELANDIDVWRLNDIEPSDLFNGPEFKSVQQEKKKAYRYYCENIESANVRTANDQMRLIVKLIQTHNLFSACFEHIIVDEYQDVNRLQHQLIKSLCSKITNVMVVGDINQCIYKFRGSNPDFIAGIFEREFTSVSKLSLSITFRYGHQLAYASNRLIYKNEKNNQLCVSHKNTPNTLISLLPDNKLVDIMNRILKANETNMTTAIVARTNADLVIPMIYLRLMNIPFKKGNDVKPLIKHSVLGFISMLLGLSLNSEQSKYDSDLFKFDVIKEFVKQSGISDSYAKVSRALTKKGQVNKTNFLQNLSSLEGFTLNLDVVKKVQSVENKFSIGTPAALVLKELNSLKLFEHVGTKVSKMIDSNDEVRTVDVLLTYLIDSDITIEALLDSLSVAPLNHSNELPIEVTTIHKAKGLEWDNVILVGLQDKRFPSGKDESGFNSHLLGLKEIHRPNIQNDESLKEERRLFYVAITRAKKRLYLLHPDDEKLEERVKKAWYSTPKFEVIATRFLYEIDYKNAEDVNNFLKTTNNYSYQTDNILGAMYTQRFRQLNRVTS